MLPPKLGSRNSGCQRLRCRGASSGTPGSSTAGAAAAGAAGAAGGAAVGAFVAVAAWWANPTQDAIEIHGICHCHCSGQQFVGQLI